MYTLPQVSSNNNLESRAFVYFYYDNKRYKFYNGNKLGLKIFPNYAKTLKERNSLLEQLRFQFHKALTENWNPEIEPINDTSLEQVQITAAEALEEIINNKLKSQYSKLYKRDLLSTYNKFIKFLPDELLKKHPKEISFNQIEKFLDQFSSSPRNYMNKRRSLSVFFSELTRKEILDKNPISKTLRKKSKAILHEIYSKQQLLDVLDYIKCNNYNLYLCALITYGCLLRPHQEVRGLKIKHFRNNFSEIQLSGFENKSGRVRTVFVPKIVQKELVGRLSKVTDIEANIFTLTEGTPFNDDYFKTQWTRIKSKMLKDGLVGKNHTLYSFRHTAVVNVYRKTKDLHVVQQLMQHSNMMVTLNYLRGLGEINNEHLKEVMPEF